MPRIKACAVVHVPARKHNARLYARITCHACFHAQGTQTTLQLGLCFLQCWHVAVSVALVSITAVSTSKVGMLSIGVPRVCNCVSTCVPVFFYFRGAIALPMRCAGLLNDRRQFNLWLRETLEYRNAMQAKHPLLSFPVRRRTLNLIFEVD